MQEIRTKVQLLVNTGCNPMATHNHECRKGQRFAICNRIMDKNNKACKTLPPKKVWLEQGCILSLSLLTTTLHGMKVTKNVNCLMSPGNPHDSTHSTCSACSNLETHVSACAITLAFGLKHCAVHCLVGCHVAWCQTQCWRALSQGACHICSSKLHSLLFPYSHFTEVAPLGN